MRRGGLGVIKWFVGVGFCVKNSTNKKYSIQVLNAVLREVVNKTVFLWLTIRVDNPPPPPPYNQLCDILVPE